MSRLDHLRDRLATVAATIGALALMAACWTLSFIVIHDLHLTTLIVSAVVGWGMVRAIVRILQHLERRS